MPATTRPVSAIWSSSSAPDGGVTADTHPHHAAVAMRRTVMQGGEIGEVGPG